MEKDKNLIATRVLLKYNFSLKMIFTKSLKVKLICLQINRFCKCGLVIYISVAIIVIYHVSGLLDFLIRNLQIKLLVASQS